MEEYSSRAGYVHARDPVSRHPQQTAHTLQFVDGYHPHQRVERANKQDVIGQAKRDIVHECGE